MPRLSILAKAFSIETFYKAMFGVVNSLYDCTRLEDVCTTEAKAASDSFQAFTPTAP